MAPFPVNQAYFLVVLLPVAGNPNEARRIERSLSAEVSSLLSLARRRRWRRGYTSTGPLRRRPPVPVYADFREPSLPAADEEERIDFPPGSDDEMHLIRDPPDGTGDDDCPDFLSDEEDVEENGAP